MSSDFTQNVIAEFRANQGRVGGELAGTPLVLIHHLGARTRALRVTPVAYSSLPDGRLVIAASNGGSPTHPAWYYNVKAHPTIDVELGTERFTALAEEVTGTARANLWCDVVATAPTLGEFQAKTVRRIPLLTLTRIPHRPGSDTARPRLMKILRCESARRASGDPELGEARQDVLLR